MKSYKLPDVLDQEEDYEKFYDAPATTTKPAEEPLPHYYENEKERSYYGDDVDFLRYHKRTTRNMHDELQKLLDSSK
jgi:hypothetical protein